jgi:hypothetical protein
MYKLVVIFYSVNFRKITGWTQVDQIRQMFAYWTIVYFGQLLKNTKVGRQP